MFCVVQLAAFGAARGADIGAMSHSLGDFERLRYCAEQIEICFRKTQHSDDFLPCWMPRGWERDVQEAVQGSFGAVCSPYSECVRSHPKKYVIEFERKSRTATTLCTIFTVKVEFCDRVLGNPWAIIVEDLCENVF